MKPWHRFHPDINLFVRDRITEPDARRQEGTARDILARLADLLGLILADEVGMGKTYVALAVAVSVSLSDRRRRPVVVMVPPSLKKKWPEEFDVFRDKCLPVSLRSRLTSKRAERGVDFLKLLDDPIKSRASVIFLTHGALSRSLKDSWVRLAIIRQALYRRRDVQVRKAVARNAASLIEVKSLYGNKVEMFEQLLNSPLEKWRDILSRHGVELDDDPVPDTIG